MLCVVIETANLPPWSYANTGSSHLLPDISIPRYRGRKLGSLDGEKDKSVEKRGREFKARMSTKNELTLSQFLFLSFFFLHLIPFLSLSFCLCLLVCLFSIISSFFRYNSLSVTLFSLLFRAYTH